MNANLLEQLLNEDEGSALDFKRDQYPFEGASDENKSELLKDILAFANAWRRTDAYILIGVEEVKGGRSKVIGVDKHLEDNFLQQFVNGKTQQPVTFSYIAFVFEDRQIGVIKIPVQTRPIYLKKDFGKLKKNIVYLRRGSSTDEASPDEIAKMGAADIKMANDVAVNLQFADLKSQSGLGNKIIIDSKVLELDKKAIPDFVDNSSQSFMNIGYGSPNKKYYKELVAYVEEGMLTSPIGFTLKNLGESTIHNAKMVLTFERNENLMMLMGDDFSSRPRKYFNFLGPMANTSNNFVNTSARSNISLEVYNQKHVLSVEFGNIQPKFSAWSDEPVFIGCRNDEVLTLSAYVFADELSEPLSVDLIFDFKTEKMELSLRDLEKHIDQEFKRLYEELDNE